MTILTALASGLAQASADTIVTVQTQTGLQVAADVALVFLAVVVAGVFVISFAFLLRMRQLDKGIRKTATRLQAGMDPVMERAGNVVENVDFITRAIRADVEKLNESVTQLNQRLRQASDRMEERIEEFNALMEVVQGEAEEIFIDTASAVRGVREGTRTLGEGIRDPRSGTEKATRPVGPEARPAGPDPEDEDTP